MNKRYRYKKFFILLFLLIVGTVVLKAQVYNNEWIDYSKTYYRFRLSSDGLYRINATALAEAGLANVQGATLQLWRNGIQIPIYVSSAGVLATADYLEFWGQHNDGSVDAPLYKIPGDQINKRFCLETDSATYFLTVNTNTAQNIHYSAVANDVATMPAGTQPEPYFLYTVQNDLSSGGNGTFNFGPASIFGTDYVYASDYKFKLFGTQITPSKSLTTNFNNLYPYTGSAVPATFSMGIVGSSVVGINRNITAVAPSGTLISKALGAFDGQVFTNGNVQVSGDFAVTIGETNSDANDRSVVSFAALTYARQFNFGNQTAFAFGLPAGFAPRYLSVSNFNANGSIPVLYDMTHARRYIAVVKGNSFQFYIPALGDSTQFALVGQSATSYTSVSAGQMTARNLPDLNNVANQGDFLIISNKALFSGDNYVQQYADYRSSAAGGGHHAKVYDIEDLTDEFSFGIKTHPLSIKNFLRYARTHFSVKPVYAFIIGRGLPFNQNRGVNESNPDFQVENLVPTYSSPASDIMLAADDFTPVPATMIGRLPAVQPGEVKIYLDKIKEYDLAQNANDNTIANNSWKKNIVFASGGGAAGEESLFNSYLDTYQNIMSDTLYGGRSYRFRNADASVPGNTALADLQNLFSQGVNFVSYFGHGASTTLGYSNLSVPGNFSNRGKYPVFLMSGCDVGDCYSYLPGRLTTINNIPERYLFANENGSVAFVAQAFLGVTSFLQNYNNVMYRNLGVNNYPDAVTYSMAQAAKAMVTPGQALNGDTITCYAHAQQTNFLGDPSIALNNFAKPDFAVDETQVSAPASVSISDTKFHVKAYLYNLGKATGDSVLLQIKRVLPGGNTDILISKNIRSIRSIDSVSLDVHIDPNKDVGTNNIVITLNGNAAYDELSMLNNSATKAVVVYADGLIPVYPYNYSIIHAPTAHLMASTSDPLAAASDYVLQMDTSANFNSLFMISKTIHSAGGVLDFDPGISYADSTVYYWRVSAAISATQLAYRWANSSFQYIKGNDDGAGQSPYFQWIQSDMQRITMDSITRKWSFGDVQHALEVDHAVYGNGTNTGWANFVLKSDGAFLSSFYCTSVTNSLMFNIFTPDGFKPYYNQRNPTTVQLGDNSTIGGFMGSTASCMNNPNSYDVTPSRNTNKYNFQFSYNTEAQRNNIARFMDWIPNGSYVVIRLFVDAPFTNVPLVNTWQNDNAGGSNNLYQQFLQQGLSAIDDFTAPKIGVFIYKKNNDGSFAPFQTMTDMVTDQLHLTENVPGKDSLGFVSSPKFGPAISWRSMQLNGYSIDSVNTDNAIVNILGIDTLGNTALLKAVNATQVNTDISFIDAHKYPYIQLRMRNSDSINFTPYQLRYWHVLYTPATEGALAANIQLISKDTLALGETLKFGIAFKNVSGQSFPDSILTSVTVMDKNNRSYSIPVQLLKSLQPGDTAMVMVTIPGDTSAYNASVQNPLLKMPVGTLNLTGANTLNINVNPNGKPLEYTHDNNFLYKRFYVKSNTYNPTLDVTFDGVHILDNDIVAAKPNISIHLTDDSKYLLLNDTSVARVTLTYPDGTVRNFNYRSDTLSFTPAKDSSNNEAVIDFRPFLTQDGTYQLSVTGRGIAGTSTATNYSVSFQAYTKPLISDMFNYPNPFTTSTAFVFTITGSVVPQNIRIEILTITGKIVKEITSAELGPLHVGRNITQYKWDGTDMYGQKLANGVYLYRVITNQDRQSLGHLNVTDGNGNTINTGKYFNKGYGKMYLMR